MVANVDGHGRGWLRFLERKLGMAGDDWSKSGMPAPVWDNMSGMPTTNWYRFDAIGVATTMMLATRAGTLERPNAVALIDGVVDRLRQYHGFNEWVEQSDPDTRRGEYPDGWRGTLIPVSQWGAYDSPGWAGNGSQENGFEANPIEAQGAIYYKGFFNYVLGLRTLIDPGRDGREPIDILYDNLWKFRYSHSEINSIVADDFTNALAGRSQGLCCEIHKLWPL